MRGKPGVVSVVKLLRSRPFGEWNVVYYRPDKTDLDTLTQRLRRGGCRNAAQIVAPPKKNGGITVRTANPIVAPGDMVQLAVALPASRSGRVAVELPQGWTRLGPATLPGGASRVDIQLPRAWRGGRVTLPTHITLKDARAPLRFEPTVTVVRLVR